MGLSHPNPDATQKSSPQVRHCARETDPGILEPQSDTVLNNRPGTVDPNLPGALLIRSCYLVLNKIHNCIEKCKRFAWFIFKPLLEACHYANNMKSC